MLPLATMASLPLAVRSKLQLCNKHYKMKFILLKTKKKMVTQYTNQMLSIILYSTLVNFYALVILYGELLLKKAAIYVVNKKLV
jgi:hypothetical protein